MIYPTISRRKILLSAALLCLSLGTFVYIEIIWRWGWPLDFVTPIVGFLLWLIWIFHLGWVLLSRQPEPAKRKRFVPEFFGAIFGAMVAFIFILTLGHFVADELRLHEIRIAVKAGLQNDCLNLLHNWPTTNDVIEGDDMDPAFSKLPRSIKMLGPGDVYNDQINDTNIPPNIGICVDGLGGGFYGIRVFRNDDDAKKLEASYGNHMCQYERVAPGVYFWVSY